MEAGMTRLLTVLLISGPIGAGKTLLAENLSRRHSADHLRTSELIAESAGGRPSRIDLQMAGLEKTFQQGEWLAQALAERVLVAESDLFILDSVRTLDQVGACRKSLDVPHRIVHVHLTAQADLLAVKRCKRPARQLRQGWQKSRILWLTLLHLRRPTSPYS
jgi:adenylosuccinate synthase